MEESMGIRQERHLMRQRGAGARPIQGNFGFVFKAGPVQLATPPPSQDRSSGAGDPASSHKDDTAALITIAAHLPATSVPVHISKASRAQEIVQDDIPQEPAISTTSTSTAPSKRRAPKKRKALFTKKKPIATRPNKTVDSRRTEEATHAAIRHIEEKANARGTRKNAEIQGEEDDDELSFDKEPQSSHTIRRSPKSRQEQDEGLIDEHERAAPIAKRRRIETTTITNEESQEPPRTIDAQGKKQAVRVKKCAGKNVKFKDEPALSIKGTVQDIKMTSNLDPALKQPKRKPTSGIRKADPAIDDGIPDKTVNGKQTRKTGSSNRKVEAVDDGEGIPAETEVGKPKKKPACRAKKTEMDTKSDIDAFAAVGKPMHKDASRTKESAEVAKQTHIGKRTVRKELTMEETNLENGNLDMGVDIFDDLATKEEPSPVAVPVVSRKRAIRPKKTIESALDHGGVRPAGKRKRGEVAGETVVDEVHRETGQTGHRHAKPSSEKKPAKRSKMSSQYNTEHEAMVDATNQKPETLAKESRSTKTTSARPSSKAPGAIPEDDSDVVMVKELVPKKTSKLAVRSQKAKGVAEEAVKVVEEQVAQLEPEVQNPAAPAKRLASKSRRREKAIDDDVKVQSNDTPEISLVAPDREKDIKAASTRGCAGKKNADVRLPAPNEDDKPAPNHPDTPEPKSLDPKLFDPKPRKSKKAPAPAAVAAAIAIATNKPIPIQAAAAAEKQKRIKPTTSRKRVPLTEQDANSSSPQKLVSAAKNSRSTTKNDDRGRGLKLKTKGARKEGRIAEGVEMGLRMGTGKGMGTGVDEDGKDKDGKAEDEDEDGDEGLFAPMPLRGNAAFSSASLQLKRLSRNRNEKVAGVVTSRAGNVNKTRGGLGRTIRANEAMDGDEDEDVDLSDVFDGIAAIAAVAAKGRA